jgi:hypothetical protein
MCARTDTARYIADLTSSLSKLAHSQDMSLLAYLLDMARMEADNCARSNGKVPEAAPVVPDVLKPPPR